MKVDENLRTTKSGFKSCRGDSRALHGTGDWVKRLRRWAVKTSATSVSSYGRARLASASEIIRSFWTDFLCIHARPAVGHIEYHF